MHKNSELEQLQNEKRKALLEHETSKLRECDEALQRELREWRSALHPRKQASFYAVNSIHILFFYLLSLKSRESRIKRQVLLPHTYTHIQYVLAHPFSCTFVG